MARSNHGCWLFWNNHIRHVKVGILPTYSRHPAMLQLTPHHVATASASSFPCHSHPKPSPYNFRDKIWLHLHGLPEVPAAPPFPCSSKQQPTFVLQRPVIAVYLVGEPLSIRLLLILVP